MSDFVVGDRVVLKDNLYHELERASGINNFAPGKTGVVEQVITHFPHKVYRVDIGYFNKEGWHFLREELEHDE